MEFDIKKGDVVGIIGRNGAGKSTLLKILSRITEPTTGEIDLYGRVGSLLEVGTGFHPELSGRENIFLNGAILGMSKGEIRKQFDAIVDFAGVEKFLDTPVKRYSSGMYVRLAFAVAAHLESEILIVDEVLAVGDSEFQRRCIGKIHDVATTGRTVLFVAHNMQAISLLCRRVLFLRGGSVAFNGETSEGISAYITSIEKQQEHSVDSDVRRGSGEYRFTAAAATKNHFQSDETKVINFEITQRHGRLGRYYLSAHIVDSAGVTLLQCDSRLLGKWIDDARCVRGALEIATPWLKPGDYRVNLYLCSMGGIIDFYEPGVFLSGLRHLAVSIHLLERRYRLRRCLQRFQLAVESARF